MVSWKISRRKALMRRLLIFTMLLCVFLIACGFSLGILISNTKKSVVVEDDSSQVEETVGVPPEVIEPLPYKIDFQPVIDEWVSATSGNKSVLIYDLERDEVVGEYGRNDSYNTASLYKLFVVYEGYRRVDKGEWDANAIAGTTGKTILECLDLSIRESYSPCAETLWKMIGQDNLDTIIKDDFGINNSDISHLISNPEDISKMMQLFYSHSDIKDESLISRMKDSFLNQPSTTYNWRQGLPSGFTKANVFNKVGWDYNPDKRYWNIYHDAAIVEFPESNRHFVVVVMTNYVPFAKIKQLGTMIENKFYN